MSRGRGSFCCKAGACRAAEVRCLGLRAAAAHRLGPTWRGPGGPGGPAPEAAEGAGRGSLLGAPPRLGVLRVAAGSASESLPGVPRWQPPASKAAAMRPPLLSALWEAPARPSLPALRRDLPTGRAARERERARTKERESDSATCLLSFWRFRSRTASFKPQHVETPRMLRMQRPLSGVRRTVPTAFDLQCSHRHLCASKPRPRHHNGHSSHATK